MDVSKLSPGKDLPHDINVVIEIPQGSQVKYEVDKDSRGNFRGPFPVHADGVSGGVRVHPGDVGGGR